MGGPGDETEGRGDRMGRQDVKREWWNEGMGRGSFEF